MHLNTEPPAAAGKPSIRDYADLVKDYMPDQLVKLVPLEELERFGQELVADQPRFAEEVPVRLAGEARRRARYKGPHVIGSRTQAGPTATQVFSHA